VRWDVTTSFDKPHDAVQENGKYGGQGKALGRTTDGFAVLTGRTLC